MIVEKIDNYLRGSNRINSPEILENMREAFNFSITRQLMEARSSSSTLRGSDPGPCPRKMAYKYLGYKVTQEFEPRTYVTFLTGDLLEFVAVGLMKLAGIECENTAADPEGQAENFFDVGNGLMIPCHPDGIILPQPGVGDKPVLLEIKTSSDFGFKRQWKKDIISEQYKLQHQVYLEAFGMDRGVFFVINKNTGHYHETLTIRDPDYIEWAKKNYELAAGADENNLPPKYVDGEAYGPKIATKTYEETNELAYMCSYCPYLHHCWDVETEISRGRPKHVLREGNDRSNEVGKFDVLPTIQSDLFNF